MPPTQVGIFTDYIGSFGRRVLQGAADYANQHTDWSLTTLRMWHFESVLPLERIPVDAIITSFVTPEFHRHVLKHRIPTVNVSTAHFTPPSHKGRPRPHLPSVILDSAAIGRAGAEFFLSRGFHHFAFASWTNVAYASTRAAAFANTLKAAGHPCAFITTDPKALATFLPAQPKPLALMASNDAAALEVLTQCQSLGLFVPESIAILGVDNDELLTSISRPRLASIDVPAHLVGYEAAALLHRILQGKAGKKPPTKPQRLAPLSVVLRPSADIFAVPDPDVAEALRFIRENAAKPIGVRDLLAHIPLSRRTLERRFLATIGRTPLEEIHRVHLDRAKQLLLDTDLPIPAVATAAGFNDDTRLNVLFRRATGMPPTAYRKTHRPRHEKHQAKPKPRKR